MKNMRLSTVLGDETDIKKAQMLNSCYSAKIIRHVIEFSLNFDNRKYPLSIFWVLGPKSSINDHIHRTIKTTDF
jgi:hypothetical protein